MLWAIPKELDARFSLHRAIRAQSACSFCAVLSKYLGPARARARVCVWGLGENIIGEKRVKASFERLGGNGIGGDRSSDERLGEWPIDGEDVLENKMF